MAQLDFWKDVAIVFGGVVALLTLLTGLVEFVRQGHQIRATRFLEMRRRFLENDRFRGILNLLDTDSTDLAAVPVQDRRNFAGFLEEVALLVNSKLISRSVAYYMFGDYVLLTAQSENFWAGMKRDSAYWTVFWEFAKTMKSMEAGQITKTPRF